MKSLRTASAANLCPDQLSRFSAAIFLSSLPWLQSFQRNTCGRIIGLSLYCLRHLYLRFNSCVIQKFSCFCILNWKLIGQYLRPWGRALENPTVLDLLKKMPEIYGWRLFILLFTRRRHFLLLRIWYMQAVCPNLISLGSMLIFSSKVLWNLAVDLILSGFHTEILQAFLLHTCHMPQPYVEDRPSINYSLHIDTVLILTNRHFMSPQNYTWKYYFWIKLIIIITLYATSEFIMHSASVCTDSVHLFRYIYVNVTHVIVDVFRQLVADMMLAW